MAIPMIYQNSRDAQAAAQENGMNNEGDLPDNSSPEESGEQATPQEQAQYDDIVTGGMAILYQTPDMASNVAKRLRDESKDKGIANAIGQQAATIMLAVTGGLKQQGANPDPDVVLNAGVEILTEIAEIALAVKLMTNDQYDKVIEEASYEATRFYGEKELQAGGISPETQKEAQRVVSENMPKDKGSLAGMTQQQPQQQAQPQASGASLAQMTQQGAR